jgi:hypothetical protein
MSDVTRILPLRQGIVMDAREWDIARPSVP